MKHKTDLDPALLDELCQIVYDNLRDNYYYQGAVIRQHLEPLVYVAAMADLDVVLEAVEKNLKIIVFRLPKKLQIRTNPRQRLRRALAYHRLYKLGLSPELLSRLTNTDTGSIRQYIGEGFTFCCDVDKKCPFKKILKLQSKRDKNHARRN